MMFILLTFVAMCGLLWALLCLLLVTDYCLPLAQCGIAAKVYTHRLFGRRHRFPAWGSILVPCAAIFGLVAGAIVYTSKISEAEERLVNAYLNADVLTYLLASSPDYLNLPSGLAKRSSCESNSGPAVDAKAVSIWIQKLLQVQITSENLRDPSHPAAGVSKTFKLPGNDKNSLFSSFPYKLGCLSTLELILQLSESIGSKAGPSGSIGEEAIIAELAAALARLPGTLLFSKPAPDFFIYMGDCPAKPDSECRRSYTQMMKKAFAGNQTAVDLPAYRLDSRLVTLLNSRIGYGFTFFRPEEVSSERLLHALFSRTNVLAKLAERRADLENNAELRQQLDFYVAFTRALLGAVAQVPEVKDASYDISFWMGLEQISVLTLIFFLLALLFGTWLADLPQLAAKRFLISQLSAEFDEKFAAADLTNVMKFKGALQDKLLTPVWPLDNYVSVKTFFEEIKSSAVEREYACITLLPFFLLEKAVLELASYQKEATPFPLATWCQQAAEKIEDSRWLFGWCLSALPAIGFLSTLYGILNALGGAGAVSAAEGRLEQALAMDTISGKLSIAFSTTIIALSGLLVLSLLDQWQAKAQRRLIEDVEQGLTGMLLPSGVSLVIVPETEIKQARTDDGDNV